MSEISRSTFSETNRERVMAFPRVLALPRGAIAAGFVALYVLLDWASYIQPFGPFGITPWSPSAGLGFVLILVFGERFVPLLFVAPLVAEFVVRGLPVPLPVVLGISAIIGTGYSLATLLLLRPRLGFRLALSSMRDLLLLLGLAVVSAAGVATLLVMLLAANGLIAWSDVTRAALRYWVGDVIGIAVVAPFLLMLLTRGQLLRATWETVFQVAAIVGALGIIFALPSANLQLFYLLFLPIVWIAVRTGLEGVSAGLVLTQIGVMAAIYFPHPREVDVTAVQTLMLVLAFTGLATGLLVTEHRRTELQLRLQQEEHARIARLGTLGELATNIAHEINQPLMAAGTYSRLVARNLAAQAGNLNAAQDAAAKTVAQIERAADVVRSLRTLVRLGRSDTAPASVARLVSAAVELVRPLLASGHINLRQEIPADLPMVMVDALQIEQVLINLMRNSIEAMSGSPAQRGTIVVSAARGAEGRQLEISVRDTGPGFTPSQLANLAAPFKTTKPSGLGIGLALSKSLVEAHGGRLWAVPCTDGAHVCLTLPTAEAYAL